MSIPQLRPNATQEERALHRELEQAQTNLAVTQTNNLKLGQVIKVMAAKNRNDGNVDNDTTYTKNVLAVREFQERESDGMSGYAKEIANSIESINTENRKLAKVDQRAKLKELNQLSQMVDSVTDDAHRLKLEQFIEDSRRSIRANTSAIGTIASGMIKHMDVITGVFTATLSESPILGMIAGFIANQVKDQWNERQAAKYAVQEAKERQLSEELRSQLRQEDELKRMADNLEALSAQRQSDEDSPESPKVVPPKAKPEPISPPPSVVAPPISQSPIRGGISDDSESSMWLEELADMTDNLTMEVMEISQTLNRFLDTNDTHLEIIEELITPLVQNREEDRRENAVFQERLLDALSRSPIVVGADGKPKEEESGGIMSGAIGAGLGGIMGTMIAKYTKMGKDLLVKGIRFIVRGIPKLIGRIFVPALIVASLFSGVMEAFDIFKKTGSIKEAAIGFFGGILDFVSFGFFGTDELNSVIGFISEITAPVVEMLKAPFEFLYNKAIEVKDNMLNWFDRNIPSMDDIGEFKDDMIARARRLKDGLVEKIMTPINRLSEIFDGLLMQFKMKMREWVSAAPDWIVPESMSAWLATPDERFAKSIQSDSPQLTIESMPEADRKSRQTDEVIRSGDEMQRKVREEPQNNVAMVDNSTRNSTTVINSGRMSAADPELTARMAQMGFNGGTVGL